MPAFLEKALQSRPLRLAHRIEHDLSDRLLDVAGFLEANDSPAKVRSQLLAAQAEASPEITSRIAPDAARPAASNPLIDAAKQIAAQSTKKEF